MKKTKSTPRATSRRCAVSTGSESGFTVEITRADGSTFLASSGAGELPPVWRKSNRRWAVKYKRELRNEGFRARVVAVSFTRPFVIPNTELRNAHNEKGKTL